MQKTVKIVRLLLNIFCAENCERLLLKENGQLIFFFIEDCMSASEDISMFFNERAAAS